MPEMPAPMQMTRMGLRLSTERDSTVASEVFTGLFVLETIFTIADGTWETHKPNLLAVRGGITNTLYVK